MIEDYSFGRIVVDGRAYTHDIIIFHDRIKESWWRLEGHLLQLADIKEVLDTKPSILIVGTGHDAVMKVKPEVRDYCRKSGITLIELWTGEAVKKYNELASPGVVGLFHLTC